MPDILDVDVSGHASVGYELVIARQAEWDRAVIDYVRQSKGATWQPNDANFRHILFRVISDERAIWKTTRNAIDDKAAENISTVKNPPDVEKSPGQIPLPSGRLVQVTNEPGIVNRGYSYWPQAWLGPDGVALVFATTVNGPILFEVRLTVDPPAVRRIGPLNGYGGQGEGMYWEAAGTLIVLDGPRMRRLKPFTQASEVLFDISERFPGCRLWQAHSSEDGTVHSATVERIVDDGAYPKLGTFLWRRSEQFWWPSLGALDESQVDASGDFVVIKEGDDNWIIDIPHGEVRILADKDGALGHSDCGAGFMVGEDNQAGACVRVDLRTLERRELFHTWRMGHVSVRGDRVLVSNSTSLRLLEISTGAMLHETIHGMTGSGYDAQPNGNLSPCGKLASFVSNRTGRFEMWLLTL